MGKIYDIFEIILPTKNTKKYIKKHKIRNINRDFNLTSYNELVSQLYKLKIKEPTNLDNISKLEFKITEYEKKFNIKSTTKIDAILSALESYYEEIKQEETIDTNKRRGLYIYEDLSYKLYKLNNTIPKDSDRIRKLELKLTECQSKYNLNESEQNDIKIKVINKYNQLLSRQEETKKEGLDIYKNLINELNILKQENIKNLSKINSLESKIKKCSNIYNLNNLDKINIQLNILEEKN